MRKSLICCATAVWKCVTVQKQFATKHREQTMWVSNRYTQNVYGFIYINYLLVGFHCACKARLCWLLKLAAPRNLYHPSCFCNKQRHLYLRSLRGVHWFSPDMRSPVNCCHFFRVSYEDNECGRTTSLPSCDIKFVI